MIRKAFWAGIGFVAGTSSLQAEGWRDGYTIYGTPGLIEMPSASALPDAEIAVTLGGFGTQQRTSFTFQITPRLTGTFRYARLDEFTGPGTADTFDRSFDLQYQLVEEGDRRPAIAIGLRDFLGTGLYTGEYIVATKTLSPSVRVTGGIGWGRLGSYGGFDNPLGLLDSRFEIRPPYDFGAGGTPAFEQFFRGDAAVFGGVEWQINDELTFVGEYSSDAYVTETGLGVVEHNSPLNFGIRYAPRPSYELSAYYLRGAELGFAATLTMNPRTRPAPSGLEPAPIPVAIRSEDMRAAQTWDRNALPDAALLGATQQALALDGITVDSVELQDRSVRVRYTNGTYRSEAQAMGHVARTLTQIMPPSVELFVLEPMQAGVPLSSVSIRRSDLESLENTPDATWSMLSRVQIGEAQNDEGLVALEDTAPDFQWSITPFAELQLFDGDNPIRGDYGIQGRIRYEISPSVVVNGSLRYRLGGNRDEGAISTSALHPVRSNSSLYGADNRLGLESLSLTWYDRPGEHLFSRVSVGYLERMYAGVSTELLWKPVDSRLALGGELNYVVQRDYDLGLGAQYFDSLGGSYDTVTGHVSAYYDFQNGFHGRVDVGRYLAGDWGATFALDREFANGWRIGAYATFTDVSFDDFGEGSFDKGVVLTIPTDWALGNATRHETDVALSSLARDGGARLNVEGRLYDIVRDGHSAALTDSWGRFWR